MIGSKALLFEAVLLLMERCMNYMKQEWQENINLLELIQGPLLGTKEVE